MAEPSLLAAPEASLCGWVALPAGCCALGLLAPAAFSSFSTLCFFVASFPRCLILEIKRCLLYKQKHDAMALVTTVVTRGGSAPETSGAVSSSP